MRDLELKEKLDWPVGRSEYLIRHFELVETNLFRSKGTENYRPIIRFIKGIIEGDRKCLELWHIYYPRFQIEDLKVLLKRLGEI